MALLGDRVGTALVIGASGAIGQALTAALGGSGEFERVIGTSRSGTAGGRSGTAGDGSRAFDDEAADATGSEAVHTTIALDVADAESIAKAGRRVRELTERLDLVLFCAGMLHDPQRAIRPEKKLADIDPEALARAFAVNASAPLLLAQQLAPLLPRQERCIWANLSARVGSIGDNQLGGWYAYRASKAAQNMGTRTLAIELGRRYRGLICVALHPGTVASGLSAPFRSADASGVMTAGVAAHHLLKVLGGLAREDSGQFFAWDGQQIPW